MRPLAARRAPRPMNPRALERNSGAVGQACPALSATRRTRWSSVVKVEQRKAPHRQGDSETVKRHDAFKRRNDASILGLQVDSLRADTVVGLAVPDDEDSAPFFDVLTVSRTVRR
jgi:hypothetical protein